MRRRYCMLLFLFLLLPSLTSAGEIFGLVWAEDDGRPAASAKVKAKRAGSDSPAKDAQADDDGVYSIYLDDGDYKISVRFGGRVSNKINLSVSGDERIDLAIKKEGEDGLKLSRR